jgi:HlyD family secretion protein
MPLTEIDPPVASQFHAVLDPIEPPTGWAAPSAAQRRRSRALPIGAAAAAVCGIGLLLYLESLREVKYVTARVDRGDIQPTVTTSGNSNAVMTVQVGSKVSGNIIALCADFNTKVKKGQLVALIDPAPFQAAVDRAQARLNAAKAAVVTARARLAYSEETDSPSYDQPLANTSASEVGVMAAQASAESAGKQVDVPRTQLDQAKALVQQDAVALAKAQLNLDHTRILAPVDGTVESRNMEVGQTVAASFPAPIIFLIAQDLTKMQVDTNVDEADVGPIRLGQAAYFTVDAYPGQVFHGTVAQIRQAPTNVQNPITYDVVIEFSNFDLKLFPGMTANATIVTGHATKVLVERSH